VPDAGNSGLTIVRTSPNTVKVSFGTIRDRVYHVLYSNAVNGTYQQAGPDIAGNGSTIDYTDDGMATGSPPTVGQRRFYKLTVALPP
jgi:hypothetical protein